jgi:uncharacterized lipoprotein YmbA
MRHLVAVTLSCLTLVLIGCGSTPNPRFYSLSSVAPTAATPADLSMAVGPVTIPAAVDRPQIVNTVGPNRVRLEEFDRWAAPLQSDIARVIVANLVVALGTPRVTLASQPVAVGVDYRAVVEVQRFDSALGDAATLDAVWSVARTRDGKLQTGRTTTREPAAERSFDALAAAHSRAVGRLSQDLANAVRELARP